MAGKRGRAPALQKRSALLKLMTLDARVPRVLYKAEAYHKQTKSADTPALFLPLRYNISTELLPAM